MLYSPIELVYQTFLLAPSPPTNPLLYLHKPRFHLNTVKWPTHPFERAPIQLGTWCVLLTWGRLSRPPQTDLLLPHNAKVDKPMDIFHLAYRVAYDCHASSSCSFSALTTIKQDLVSLWQIFVSQYNPDKKWKETRDQRRIGAKPDSCRINLIHETDCSCI